MKKPKRRSRSDLSDSPTLLVKEPQKLMFNLFQSHICTFSHSVHWNDYVESTVVRSFLRHRSSFCFYNLLVLWLRAVSYAFSIFSTSPAPIKMITAFLY